MFWGFSQRWNVIFIPSQSKVSSAADYKEWQDISNRIYQDINYISGYIIESQDIGIYTIIYQDIRMYLTGRGLAIELAFHSILAGHYWRLDSNGGQEMQKIVELICLIDSKGKTHLKDNRITNVILMYN